MSTSVDEAPQPFPNLFIVGAARSGTTSLHNYLAQHPQIFMSSTKEPHFFADVDPDAAMAHLIRPVKDERSYRLLFKDAVGFPVVGRVEPLIPVGPHFCAKDPQRGPRRTDRSPPSRSRRASALHFLGDVREGLQDLAFREALAQDAAVADKEWGRSGHLYVELGMYADQVGRYLDEFPREQIHVTLFDDLVRTPAAVLEELAVFLHIDLGPMLEVDTSGVLNSFATPRNDLARRVMAAGGFRRLARHIVPRGLRAAVSNRLLLRRMGDKPAIDSETRARLPALYEPDLRRLEGRLGQSLPSLRGQP